MTQQSIFTVGDVAAICGVAPRTVQRWIDDGRLAGYYLPSRERRVPRNRLVEFLEAHAMPLDRLEAFEETGNAGHTP